MYQCKNLLERSGFNIQVVQEVFLENAIQRLDEAQLSLMTFNLQVQTLQKL